MVRNYQMAAAGVLIAVGMILGGCSNDRPHEVGRMRPPVDDLDKRDRGLQSKDLIEATDLMTQSLATLPELNQSAQQWTIVFKPQVENNTTTRQNYDIFISRFRVQIAKQAR